MKVGGGYGSKIHESLPSPDLTEIFCDADDFYRSFEQYCRSIPQLTAIADFEGVIRLISYPLNLNSLIKFGNNWLI